MARPRQALLVTSFSLFVACNAILGNEDHYTLVPPDPGGDAGAPGSAGAGAAGDAGSGGDGGAGVAQGGAAGGPSTGGAAGAGGVPGTGGQSGGGEAGAGGAACTPTGAENCFNRVDDDCNGQVDCADAACATPAACVPAPAGATIGTFPLMGSACPAGYAPLALRRGLSADPICQGCLCTPDAPRCESGIYGHGSYPCPSYQFSGPLHNSFSDRCEGFSGDQSVHFYAVRGFTTCTASGTASPAAASWAETRSICAAERVGGGCAAGSVCAPRVTSPHCAIRRGEATCGGTYPTSTGETWYTGISDGRSCPTCSCAFGSATCTGARIQLFETTNCTGTAYDLGSGLEGDVCAVPIVGRSSKVLGTPTNASCEPNTYPMGELMPTDPRTVCCE